VLDELDEVLPVGQVGFVRFEAELAGDVIADAGLLEQERYFVNSFDGGHRHDAALVDVAEQAEFV
jgi:hypothetical protein